MNYTQHPLSAAFPAMLPEDFQRLKDSIENLGVQNPITIFEGMVLDGWHRYRAACELDMPCPEQQLEDWIDPKDFVLAQNKARRHITVAQLATATTAVYAWRPVGNPQFRTECGIGQGEPEPVKSSAELAEIAGVSARSIEQAKAIHNKAAPEVVEAIKRGDVGLVKAAAIANLPKAEQVAALARPLADIKAKKPPEPEPANDEEPEDFGPSEEELRAAQLQDRADREAFDMLLLADDKLAAANAEIKRLNAVNAVLESRLQGLQNEKNEAIALVRSRDRQIAKLEAMLRQAA